MFKKYLIGLFDVLSEFCKYIVSAYVHNSGQVLSVSKYENKKISEVAIVSEMIDALGLQGVTFSMDALHCKKNG